MRHGSVTSVSRGRGRAIGVLGAVAASAVLVSGCGDAGKDEVSAAATTPPAQRVNQPTTGGLTEDQTERKALVDAAKTGWEEAADAAVAKVPGGKLVEIELKRSDGVMEWDSEIATADGTSHDVQVDAVTGQVTQSRVEGDQDNEDRQQLADRLGKAKTTAQQAATTATDRKKGTVTSVGLGGGNGGAAPVWSVDVVTADDWSKTDFDIDAVNGEVLRQEVDRD
ncbi:PepSY domain-containing protein [Streptomyces formicae]|uniref:PepSY domain-containing protein n=1 Tax=Streptomyces formicae TaxID=1616117 RepID=A0ABY3WQV0_9ACTN|nr:PepSY domain-containing protein [Streptomyces formicae]UNM12920.1 PepSY domain-containing protein [Streptomyces formicae]